MLAFQKGEGDAEARTHLLLPLTCRTPENVHTSLPGELGNRPGFCVATPQLNIRGLTARSTDLPPVCPHRTTRGHWSAWCRSMEAAEQIPWALGSGVWLLPEAGNSAWRLSVMEQMTWPGVLSFQGLAPVPAWTTGTHTHEVLSPTPRSTSLPIGWPVEPPGHLPVSCPMHMPDPSLEPFLPAAPAAHTTPSPPPSFPTRPSAVASGPGSYGPSSALQSSPQPELEKCKSDRMASGLGLHRAFPWLSGQKSKATGCPREP
ncbi:uncharacterized membrane protein MT3943-like isoform X3 [Ursus maritimus]|uniref:Uncharacterized membrane protein MT3943-like isoform X3 n=1 Tax=Ursus maritimus TaxID=29073 RepID=A0A8M1GKK7_URSMA|nr:uncharacterized membrane protein MT3943-like isoform X3 [Ursus maritimus]